MDSDSSSEDEVFFGPITDKEKQIAARYHGRKTLILPQRNPLYRRWSTTHIPSTFIIGDNKVTLAPSSNSPATSQCVSQDCCSSTTTLAFGRPAGSLLLSSDGGEKNYSSALTDSAENSFEASHEEVSPLTMTNTSCYSSVGNLADDERSVYSVKLPNVSSPVPQSENDSKLMEATQLQGLCVVATPPQDPVIYRNTVSALSSYPSTPVLLEEGNQQSNFSSPKITQYDHPHSLAIPTSDSSTLTSLTRVDMKPSSNCPREPFINPRKPDENEPSISPRKPDDSELPIIARKPDDTEPCSRPRKPDDTKPCSRPRKPDDSEPSISPRKPDDSEPSISPRKPDDSEPSIHPRKPDDSEASISPRKADATEPSISPRMPDDTEPSISPRKPDDSESSISPRKPDDSEPSISPRKPDDSEPSISPRKPDDSEPSISPRKPDDSESSISPRKPDDSEPSISPRKPDDSESSISPRKLDDTEPCISPRKPDDTEPCSSPRKPDNSESFISPRKPDDSEPSIIPRKRDDTEPSISPRKPNDSESSISPRKPDDSEPCSSPRKPGDSEPCSSPRKPGDSEPCSSPRKPGDSEPCSSPRKPGDSEPSSSPRKPDNNDHFSSPQKPDSSACESGISPHDPSCNSEECVGSLRVSGSHLSKSPASLQAPDSSLRELNESSSFSSSPRFNDTLEEIEQFLKYGADYGEKGMILSDGTQRHSATPTDHSRDTECSPRKIVCSPRELSVSPKDSHCISDESDTSFIDPNRKPKEPDHGLRECCLTEAESSLIKSSPSAQKSDRALRELSASASFPVSPRFNDTLEEIEEFLKYGAHYGENSTAVSDGSQRCIINSARSSCSSNFQPPLESTRASGAVAGVVDNEEKNPSLQEEEHTTAPVPVERTPLHSPLQAKTLHATAAHSLPPLPTTTAKAGLARPVQRVTPSSRAPVSLPRSQPVRAGVGSSIKTTTTPKVVKSQLSSHTPTTSRIQPQIPRVNLQLGSSVVTPTPKSGSLPPHPHRRPVPRPLPKKTQASTSDGRHQRVLWHKSVASPLAKELRNNPPPPLVVNVKSTSSQSPGKWHPPSSPSCQQSYLPLTSSCNLLPKGGKLHRAVEGTPSPTVSRDVKDSHILPVANYKTGKSVILNNKDNKENTRRQCCKPAPVHVKVIKHTGRMMVPKPQNSSQGGHRERPSLMEVSVHQPISDD